MLMRIGAEEPDMDDELKALLTQLVTKVEVIKAGQDRLAADVAEVKADVAGVKADVAGVKADVAGVKADLAGVKHTTAANHFKLVGHIDRVASMLADHMADGHRPAAE
jgi:uncharacterized protein (UPF0335 family)